MKKHITVIHGPNLNLLGMRETGIYGKDSIETVNALIKKEADRLGVSVSIYQSNVEGEIVNLIQKSVNDSHAVILNAAAYTHYSVAIHDAVSAIKIPCIEVHMSNTLAREEFRHTSMISGVCTGTIAGFGKYSYILALIAATEII